MKKNNKNNGYKHVGILTFHYVLNPGSALQAYALCRIVNSLDLNVKCDVINYEKKNWKWHRCYAPGGNLLTGVLLYGYTCVSTILFQKFERKMIPLSTKQVIKRSDLVAVENQYDFFIVGSDQVWNTKSLKHVVDDSYFLDFCMDAQKKISYAASIGLSDFPEEDKPRIKSFLDDFEHIAVREPQAQDIVEKLIGRKPELVVDPTLLLDYKAWSKLAVLPNRDNYIFLYLRHKNSEVVPYARAMAKKLGLKIVEYHSGARKIFDDDKLLIHPQPLKWLGWLLKAKYVFTDSFHGSIFSINLNKQFFVKVSSANAEMSSRIYNILDRYDMKDRMVSNVEEMFAKPEIDFSKSNLLLEKDREFALNYLKTALDIKQS